MLEPLDITESMIPMSSTARPTSAEDKGLKRKRDSIKVIDSSSAGIAALDRGIRCMHCNERYYLTEKKGDIHNLFCTECGGLTPLRTIKHARGLSAPMIQQQSMAVQSRDNNKRMPKRINSKKNPLEDDLIRKGYTVINSDYIEP